MSVPSDFVKVGAGVGGCGGGCLHKCGKGTKSVFAVGYYDFYPPFDHISGQQNFPTGVIAERSFFSPVNYLTLSVRRTFYDGTVMNYDVNFSTITGQLTINVILNTYPTSPAYPFITIVPDTQATFFIGPQFVSGYGGKYSLTATAYSASLPPVSNFSQYVCVSESITLSNPYTWAQAQAAANALAATVPLTLPGVYTLTSGPTVTFDYPGSDLQPGTTALISGITANPDGTFSKTNAAGLSMFDNDGTPGVSGLVAANGMPTSAVSSLAYLTYNFPPTGMGGGGNNIGAANSLATAVKYTITAERTGTLDTQPFQVPLSPCTGHTVLGNLVPFQGDTIPAVLPASVNLIPNAEIALIPPLTGETIFMPADAPASGVLGVTLKTTSPTSVGAGSTTDSAGEQQAVGGGGGGL